MSPERYEEPFLSRHPWIAALLLASAGTPAAVILAQPAPSPLDALLAWPLVLVDRLVGPGRNVAAGVAGIVLTWLFYILLARFVIWRVTARLDH